MGSMRRMQSVTAGTNRRGQYASGRYDDRPRTEEQLEAAMEALIQQAHCRLLERATGGRWTWLNDTIVPGPNKSRRINALRPEACELANDASDLQTVSQGVTEAVNT